MTPVLEYILLPYAPTIRAVDDTDGTLIVRADGHSSSAVRDYAIGYFIALAYLGYVYFVPNAFTPYLPYLVALVVFNALTLVTSLGTRYRVELSPQGMRMQTRILGRLVEDRVFAWNDLPSARLIPRGFGLLRYWRIRLPGKVTLPFTLVTDRKFEVGGDAAKVAPIKSVLDRMSARVAFDAKLKQYHQLVNAAPLPKS